MDRAEKEQELKFLNDCFTKAQIAVCADYRGLTVAQITKLRRELRANKAVGRVVKNTLARLAVNKVYGDSSQEQRERFLKMFEGPNFVIFSDKDPVAPTKVLTKFAKENEKFAIKGAFLEGAFVDKAGVDTLSKMPGKEETMAKLLALMMAPATQLVRMIQAPGASLVRVIEAQRKEIQNRS